MQNSNVKVINWMRTVPVNASVYVEPSSVSEIQMIIRNEDMFPSPVRPAGRILSPSCISSNEGGTTISTANLTNIYGVKRVIPGRDLTAISCIDCEPGVTLRELQIYANKNGLEIPFSAEIGSATVGGTCFAVTKDSSIGEHPLKGMGLGDMASMLWSVNVVEDDGEVHEYCIFDGNGSYDCHFQNLLDSYGVTCIAVRMMIVARPKTPLTTIIDISHFQWRNEDVCNKKFDQIYQDWLKISSKHGNVLLSISLNSNMILLEHRLVGKTLFAPFSTVLAKYYTWKKKRVLQRGGDYPFILKILSNKLLKNSVFTRFHQQSRSPGNHYDMDIPRDTPKLSFTNVAFPIEKFQEVMTGMLGFTREYEATYNYKPKMVATYIVKLSGIRAAGPYSIKSSHVFFFDPTTDNPKDARFMRYVKAFNVHVKLLGGKPSLNQTLCLETDPTFGATALSIQPSSRFETEWLKRFTPFVSAKKRLEASSSKANAIAPCSFADNSRYE